MKKLFYIVISVILLFAPGCKKYLDRAPLNNVTVSTFFQTESDIKQFVDGLYSSMVPNMNTPNFDFCSDLNALSPARGDAAFTDLSLGSFNSTSGSISFYWDYSSIRNAYIFFDKVKNIPMTEEARRLYTGSVNYLLAYRYFMMFRAYENVPIVREVLEVNKSDIGSSPKEEVFAEALKQVNDAVANLPSLGPVNRERGRLTKLAALTLKADLLLYTASRYKEAVTGANYQVAADAALAAITEADAKGYGLATSYPKLFIAANQAAADAQKEIILEFVRLQNIATGSSSNYNWRPRHDGIGIASFLGTQELVDMYESTNGKPINKSSLYDPLHPFANRDPRLTHTILYPGNVATTIDASDTWISNTLDPVANNRDYMLSTFNPRDASVSGYINIKYWDRDPVAGGYGSYIVYRYAELLLMYAEAKNEASGPDEKVYEAISKVRNRVSMPLVNASTHPSKADVRALVRNERVVELVGEGKRYWDVRRWGIGEQVQNKPFYSMHISRFNADGSFAGYQDKIYVRTSLTNSSTEALFDIPSGATGGRLMTTGVFNSAKYYVWPIPQSALNSSYTGSLKQHSLWK
ncbi:RagB/SusD family nutrient uptake outer membrane protein [Pedobacter nyackensis]|uniref:Starch-binding associating with outer membrane n=1 Tax=Pedobacter nyackensis TaxID=475255 RepID=A0A1W2D396_9SPHI|nr:RagB/SusD family nutrient uptake outer membrane protein [Pedobacter nyackensis]SMC91891.1 Starch-binding associating with outer membrane [Pedobacter nyackensis]